MSLKFRHPIPLLQVFDMRAAVEFYCGILGFKITAASGAGDEPGWVMLKRKKVELMLNTAYEPDARPQAPDPARVAAHADTILYFWTKDVDGAYAYFRDRGLDLKEPATTGYGMKQLYLTDPDGYGVCFQCAVGEDNLG